MSKLDCNAACIVCHRPIKTFKSRPNGELHVALYALNRHFRLGLHYRSPKGVSEHIIPQGFVHTRPSTHRLSSLCTCPLGQRLWP